MSRRAMLIFVAAGCAFAQAADSPTFEVATVKASPPQGMGMIRVGMRGGPGTQDPGRYTCEHCSLMLLLSQAYDINAIQISGPDWLRSQVFDVEAKVPQGATKAQFRVMLENLLIERFKLESHRATKEAPIYELTVAKGGPKLTASAGPAEQPKELGGPGPGALPRFKSDGNGFAQFPAGRQSMAIMENGKVHMRRVDESMADFAKVLQQPLGRAVVDATGLQGKYDIELYYAGGQMGGRGMLIGGSGPPPPMPPPGGGGPPGAETSNPDDNGPTIFAALQEQLGLKLESKKGPVETLVVDHMEKTPTEN